MATNGQSVTADCTLSSFRSAMWAPGDPTRDVRSCWTEGQTAVLLCGEGWEQCQRQSTPNHNQRGRLKQAGWGGGRWSLASVCRVRCPSRGVTGWTGRLECIFGMLALGARRSRVARPPPPTRSHRRDDHSNSPTNHVHERYLLLRPYCRLDSALPITTCIATTQATPSFGHTPTSLCVLACAQTPKAAVQSFSPSQSLNPISTCTIPDDGCPAPAHMRAHACAHAPRGAL